MSTNHSSAPLTKEEEQSFWETHNPADFTQKEQLTDQFENLKPSTKIITLRVPEHLLTNLKLIANKRDIPYQSLLKVFLQEKVREEMQTPFLQLRKKVVRKTITGVAAVVLALSLTYGYVVQPVQVLGASMSPNYPTKTYYFLDKLSYDLDTPKRGEVVVFHSPLHPGEKYIKRIVGLPNETVMIKDGTVYINGEKIYEPYAQGETIPKSFPSDMQELTVPGNSYYVLGDNRSSSIDSREFGFIAQNSITGKVTACYWNCQ